MSFYKGITKSNYDENIIAAAAATSVCVILPQYFPIFFFLSPKSFLFSSSPFFLSLFPQSPFLIKRPPNYELFTIACPADWVAAFVPWLAGSKAKSAINHLTFDGLVGMYYRMEAHAECVRGRAFIEVQSGRERKDADERKARRSVHSLIFLADQKRDSLKTGADFEQAKRNRKV